MKREPNSSQSRSRCVRVLAPLLGFLAAVSLSACGPQPTAQPTPAALTESEADSLVQQAIDKEWEKFSSDHPDQDRPQVAIVRTIALDEWVDVLPPCMAEQGFKVAVGDDGGIDSGNLPPEQAGSYALAMYVCDAKYPLDAKYSAPLTESQIRYIFDYYAGDLTRCLTEQGYKVAQAPSWQSFYDSYGSGNFWTPYQGLGPLPPSDFAKLNKACPQNPDGIYG